MKAVVHDRYGGPEVLRVEEVEQPVPEDDEVRVKVHAATVNRTDCGWRGPHPFFARFFPGLRRPKERILGSDFAGEVDAVGAAVTEFAVGDHVVGSTGGFRANAEFVCVRESATVAHKPAGMTLEEAASICEGAFYALKCLRAADVGEGRRIVVYGASGAIGTAGVQLAKHLGAHVTAVCDTQNLELMRSLGADEVLDYTREDFTESGETYDVVFDAAGKHSFRRCRRSLKPGGTYVTTDLGFLWHVPALILLTRWIGDKRVLLPIANPTKNDLLFLQNLIEAGSTGPSSIGPIRSRTWSRRRGTSKRARRPETSS